MSRMNKQLLILFAVIFLVSCSTVMLTGRRQFNIVSDSDLNEMSFTSYKELKDSLPLSKDVANTALVKRVGTNIAAAVEKFMKENGYAKDLSGYEWEYNLFDVNQANAFAMPGGKIAVFTGILPITQTETGLAVVLGHEVAHVIAKHSAERLSQQVATQYGGAIIGAVAGAKSEAMQQTVGMLYGIGVQAGVLLPFSRKQELEADELGLYFMAMAGYDPREAVSFWQRMSQGGGAAVPQFLSTHPSDEKRIKQLQDIIPKALQYYKTNAVPKL